MRDNEIMRRGEMLRSLIESDGWKIAQEILDGYIKAVNDITLLDTNSPIDDIGKEAYARAKAINLVRAWYNAIQNEVENFETNVLISAESSDKDIVRVIE